MSDERTATHLLVHPFVGAAFMYIPLWIWYAALAMAALTVRMSEG